MDPDSGNTLGTFFKMEVGETPPGGLDHARIFEKGPEKNRLWKPERSPLPYSLAVDPVTREVIGLSNQILHRRTKVRKRETQAQRRKRKNRESRLWLKGTTGLPAERKLIDVCDRGTDTFEFLEHATHSSRRFVIRSSYNRSTYAGHDTDASRNLLHDFARTFSRNGTCWCRLRIAVQLLCRVSPCSGERPCHLLSRLL